MFFDSYLSLRATRRHLPISLITCHKFQPLRSKREVYLQKSLFVVDKVDTGASMVKLSVIGGIQYSRL